MDTAIIVQDAMGVIIVQVVYLVTFAQETVQVVIAVIVVQVV